jgi:hypothetical protein
VAGAPGIVFYRVPEAGDLEGRLFAVQTYEWLEGKIHKIDHFMAPIALEAFDLPQVVPA